MRRIVAGVVVALSVAGCGLTGSGDRSSEPVLPRAQQTPDAATAEADALRFAVLGDFGTGEERQQQVADRMCRWHSHHAFETVFTTGDNIYPDGDPELFGERFHDVYRCLFERGVRFRSVVGNHDVMTDGGRPELEDPAFGMPAFNYVVKAGGIRFVMVDSERLKRRWLRRKVYGGSAARATIVVMHHPVFSAGTGHGSTPGFDDLHRMFRRAGVDLVLQGHDHVYSATKKLRGVRYVVTGGGGASLGGCRPTEKTALCARRYHFLYGEVKGDVLIIKAIPRVGAKIHRFQVPLAPASPS